MTASTNRCTDVIGPQPRRTGRTRILADSFVAAILLLVACRSSLSRTLAETDASLHWTRAFDFDGDHRNDDVAVSFSGGAHCCYGLVVRLTSTGEAHRLPFQLDGGYVGGLDLSRPDRFDIRETDGGLPEIVMVIESYNGVLRPIPKAWTDQYGFRTNRIAVGFPGGQLRIRDWPIKAVTP